MKVLKYKRGQIWWYEGSDNYDGAIQGKKRPYLIISNDLANAFSKVLMGIPFTSSVKKYIPTHLTLDFAGRENTLLAEQITSLNVDKLLSYVGTLDDEAMNKAEQCIKIAVGLESALTDCTKGVTIRHVCVDSEQEDASKEVGNNNDGVYRLTEKGKELMNKVKSAGLLPVSKKRGATKKYTDEYKRDYIEFYEKYGVDECLKKYGDKDIKAVRNKLYVFRKSLNEVI